MIRSTEPHVAPTVVWGAVKNPNKTLNEDIKGAETPIYGLKRHWPWQHNATVPVSKLPPEVLGLVFELVANADRDSSQTYQYRWLNISHTCSRWRELALGSANLWTYITLNASQWWVETLLDRSQKAPLVVEVDLQNPYIKNISPVWAQIPRIRRLSISVAHNPYARQHPLCAGSILPSVPVVADILESVTLRVARGSALPIYLLENIFAARTPRLRQLELHNCDFDRNSPFLTGITSFTLTSRLDGLSGQMIIAALENMSKLETLFLGESILSVNETPRVTTLECPPVHERTPLRRLAQLSIINARVVDCLHILNQFTFPALSTVKLILEGAHNSSELEDLASVVSRLINDEGLGTRRPFRHLDAWCNFSWRVELEAWDAKTVDASEESPPFCLWVTLPGRKRTDICNSLIGILPLEGLQYLGVHDFGTVDWSLFGQLRSLRSLSAGDFISDAGLIQALVTEIPLTPRLPMGTRKGQPTSLYFPSLRELKVQGWGYNEERDRWLRRALMKRKESHMPIAQLTLVLCDVSAAQEEGLCEIVEHVVVDRHP